MVERDRSSFDSFFRTDGTRPAAWIRTVALNLVRSNWRATRTATAISPRHDQVDQPVDADGRVAEFAVGGIPGAVGSDRQNPRQARHPPSSTAPDRYTTDTAAPPARTDTGDTLPDDCAIRVIITPGADRDDVRQLTQRHTELTFDQQRSVAEVADELREFPFVVSVTAPGDECADQGLPLTISPAG